MERKFDREIKDLSALSEDEFNAAMGDDFEDKPLGYDDPNCCDECGSDLAKDGFCWECDF